MLACRRGSTVVWLHLDKVPVVVFALDTVRVAADDFTGRAMPLGPLTIGALRGFDAFLIWLCGCCVLRMAGFVLVVTSCFEGFLLTDISFFGALAFGNLPGPLLVL